MILVSSNKISESTAQGGFQRICLTALKFKMIGNLAQSLLREEHKQS